MKYAKIMIFAAVLVGFLACAQNAPADSVDDEIAVLNNVIKAENLPWKAERNWVVELTPEQRRELLGGPMTPTPVTDPTESFLQETDDISSSPDYSGGASLSWDWRSYNGQNWMSPVSSQGSCGDCWAHATCGSFEVRLKFQRGGTYGYELPIDLSQRYAASCSNANPCNAWNVPSLLTWIQANGVTDEDCLPYSHTVFCADRCSNWSNRDYTITGHGTYNAGTSYLNNVMTSCEYNGPIIVWMMVYDDFYGYSGGIYIKSPDAIQEGGHFVVILGWGNSGGTDYWICKNSWNTTWGVDGYFFIRRGTNESRIEEQAYWLTPQTLPNLTSSTPTGWDYPIVPRGDNTAASDNCHVSATLPGNSSSTYWNANWKNIGSVEARDNVTHLTVDGIYTYWLSITFQSAGADTKHINWGPVTVRGGRHTIGMDTIDYDNRVWESYEYDNTYYRQFIWSPYGLSNNVPVTRGAPPQKDSPGYSWYNNDGFSFEVEADYPDDWWSVVGVLPSNAAADYDVRLWDIGDYTGSEDGFGGDYLEYSSYSGSVCDFVIVNDNKAVAGTYYAGAINDNHSSGDFRIEEDTSEKIFPRPGTTWNGPYSKSGINVLDIYEVYISAGEYYFYLDQTAGTCDLAMALYDDETIHCQRGEYMSGSYANSGGDGADEEFKITIPDSGYHALVIWKADSSDYGKTCSYQIAVSQPSITVLSPNGGETWPAGFSYAINWESFGAPGDYVKIEISRDSGFSWSTIIDSTSNDGSYSWPITTPGSSNCRIRITSTANSAYYDISDSNFTILEQSHNECVDAIPITYGIPYYGSTVGATGTDITSCTYQDTKDVWHSFVPSNSGQYMFDLYGSNYDSALAVFDGCGGGELACNDYYYTSFVSRLLVDLNANQTYYVRVAGYNNGSGNYVLTATMAADVNNNTIVGPGDLGLLSADWLAYKRGDTDIAPQTSDYTWGDGYVDLQDFCALAEGWLKSENFAFTVIPLDYNPGWSVQGQWAFGQPGGAGGANGNPDPASAYTGSYVYGVNLAGDYDTTVGGPYYLTSTVVNCSGYSSVALRFARWLNTDYPNYVISKVEVSNDGANWDVAWAHTGSPAITDNSWNIVEYDISSTAGNQSRVYVRWSYEIGSGAWAYSGWNIDDVEFWCNP